MKLLLPVVLTLLSLCTFAQRKNSTVSVSHYPNAELYLKADVVCRITDKTGKPAANGGYLSIENKSGNTFSYNYPAAAKSLRTVSPGKKVVIPVKRGSAYSFVPLKVAYTPVTQSRPYQRMKELRAIHSESDRLTFKDGSAPTKPTYAAPQPEVAQKKPVVKPSPKPAKKVPALAKTPATKPPAVKNTVIVSVKRQSADSLRCIDTDSPAYYTFFYLKVNNEVIYSNIFAVPEYTLEEEGLDLLEQAWLCFVLALRTHYSEQQVDEMLNDRDNDLQLGLLHLRDPFIPSSTIAEKYPYARSFEAAQSEQNRWIAADKLKYPGIGFVSVIF